MREVRTTATKIYQYLSNVATGIVGRRMHVSNVAMPDALGYTEKGNDIHVAFRHELYDGLSDSEADMFRLGVTVHECLHQVFTNFNYAMEEHERLRRTGYFQSEYDEWVYHEIMNLIEDPAIESMAPQVVGGLPLKALRFAIRMTDTKSDYERASKDEIHEVTKALIEFGDVGLIKFEWVFDKAREVFLKIAPLFYDAINEPDGKVRIDAALPIHKELRTLYREGAKKDENESLSRSADANGKGSGKPGKPSSTESDINRKRKITIKKIKRDEWEKMKKEQEGSEKTKDDGTSDITVYMPEDAKAEKEDNPKDGTSIPIPMEASGEDGEKEDSSSKESSEKEDVDIDMEEDKSSEKKEGSKKDESENSDESSEDSKESDKKSSKEDESEKSEGKDKSDDKSESETSKEDETKDPSSDEEKASDKDADSEKPDSDENEDGIEPEDEANPFELSDEELSEMEEADFELSDEELDKIAESIEAFDESKEPAEGIEEHKREAANYDDVIASELCTTAKCANHVVNAPSKYAKSYEALKAPYAADIDMLRDELREIFHEDSAKSYFARSGRVNLKRMISRQSSTRLFERTERSTDKENIAIYMMVDMSGSTCGAKIEQERLTAILTAEALSEFNIPLYITGFTDNTAVDLYHFVRWDNTEEERWGLLDIKALYDNFDAYCVRYAEEMLKARPEKRKLFIMVSDGAPLSRFAHGKEAIEQNARTVAHMKEAGIAVLTMGVGDVPQATFEYMYGKDSFIDVSNPNKLFEKLAVALRAVINGEEEI